MTTGRINQVTASVLTGPGGPHRRASVARGHDAVLLLCFAIDRAPAAHQGPTAPIQDNLVNRLCKLCVLLL